MTTGAGYTFRSKLGGTRIKVQPVEMRRQAGTSSRRPCCLDAKFTYVYRYQQRALET